MFYCLDCGDQFESASSIIEDYFECWGFSQPKYIDCCPSCDSYNFLRAIRCSICDEFIDSDFIVTENDESICNKCYTIKKINDCY